MNKNKKPIVYTIIVTYNRLELLKKCLDSVKKQTYPIKKIVVVDNYSVDGTREYLQKIQEKDKRFQIIFNKDNLGMANAINLALSTIAVEKWDYLWISDDDNVADKDALENLIKYANNNSLLNSLLINTDKKTLSFELRDIKNLNFFRKVEDLKKTKNISYLTPFNFTLIPRKHVEFLSEEYFIRGEEIDYTLKKILQGVKIQIIPESKVFCLNKRTTKKYILFGQKISREIVTGGKIYYLIRNIFLIIKKYQKAVKKSGYKNLAFNYYPFLKYNFIIFFVFYFFYNIAVILIFNKNKIGDIKYLILSYLHIIIGKKGRI